MSQLLTNYAEKLTQAQMPAGKKKVLKTALKLFASNGFHATTTAKIAREAGVSEGTIYKYFSSKEDLLAKLLHPVLAEIKHNFFGQLGDFADLKSLVAFVVTDRLQFITANFDFIRLIAQEALTDQLTGQLYGDIVTGPNGVFPQLTAIQHAFPEINQSLTPVQLVRAFTGPILTYSLQTQLFHVPGDKADLALIQRQIIASLTSK
ncbi:MAG TPA: TetR/AcrR family transcriptional regulator [Candidatus Limosilactobacillus intestinigallinarum]|jgi:AcrR family transcriptional regulator|nr:TetR/AcrR family transcriptional regulator [Candidatus Limosilactobacillus intestinigallinarum]